MESYFGPKINCLWFKTIALFAPSFILLLHNEVSSAAVPCVSLESASEVLIY